MRFFLLCLLFVSSLTFASDLKIAISGQKGPNESLIVNEIFHGRSDLHPGANGKFVLKAIADYKNGIGLINSSMYNNQLQSDSRLDKVKVIGIAGNVHPYLVKAKGHKISRNPILAGGTGYCELMIANYAKIINKPIKYIQYNNIGFKEADILSERIDIGCSGVYANSNFDIIRDFAKEDNLNLYQYVVVNKDINISLEQELIYNLQTASKDTEVVSKFKALGSTLSFKSNEDIKNILINERNFWINFKK